MVRRGAAARLGRLMGIEARRSQTLPASEFRPVPVEPPPATRSWALLGNLPAVLASVAVVLVGSAPLAVAWFAASRLAYVLGVGLALRAESLHRALSRKSDPERAWRRFRDRAHWLMVGDAVALGALCVVTRGTIELSLPRALVVAAGLALIVLGVGVKLWATRSLDEGTFYWRDFFVPVEHGNRSASGPYRWLSNPMYTVGYAHAYGFALLLGSGPGLVGSALAQAAIWLLAVLVERPHVRRLGQRTSAVDSSSTVAPATRHVSERGKSDA